MASVIRLDTHVVAWLYAGDVDRLSGTARRAIDADVLVISPLVQLELTFLHEIGRLRVAGGPIVDDLAGRIGLTVSDVPLVSTVAAAEALEWTRDPFDRMIVADAIAAGTPLLTRDDTIRARLDTAVW